MGFRNTFLTSLDAPADHAQLEVHAGSSDGAQSSVILKLLGSSWMISDLLRAIFCETIESWEPWYASCQIESTDGASFEQPMSEIPIGWLTYIRDHRVSPVVPKRFRTEARNGGVLVELPLQTDERLACPSQGFQELRSALGAAGLLADPIS